MGQGKTPTPYPGPWSSLLTGDSPSFHMYALASANEDVSGAPADRHSGVPATEYRDIPTDCAVDCMRQSGVFVRISVGIQAFFFFFFFSGFVFATGEVFSLLS